MQIVGYNCVTPSSKVYEIVYELLGYQKVPSRWVAKHLTEEQLTWYLISDESIYMLINRRIR